MEEGQEEDGERPEERRLQAVEEDGLRAERRHIELLMSIGFFNFFSAVRPQRRRLRWRG